MTIAFGSGRKAARLRPFAFILGLGALMGCATDLPEQSSKDHYLVEPVRVSHQVLFASDTAEMGSGAVDELLSFLSEVDPDNRGEIYLDANGPLSDQRLDIVAGLLRDIGRTPSGAGGAATADFAVTVTVSDDVVLPASCLDSDDWPHPNLPPASCTNALSLVRMVEDPDDLIRGRKLGPASSARAADTALRFLQEREQAAEEAAAELDPGRQSLPSATTQQNASY